MHSFNNMHIYKFTFNPWNVTFTGKYPVKPFISLRLKKEAPFDAWVLGACMLLRGAAPAGFSRRTIYTGVFSVICFHYSNKLLVSPSYIIKLSLQS